MGSPQLQKVSNKRQQQQQQSGAAKPLSTIGNGVEIRSSSLPGAGNGLFADRHFARGDLITEYVGQVITHEEAQLLRASHQHTHVRVLDMRHAYIDGLKQARQGEGGGSFANDARDAARTNSVYDTRFDRHTARSRVYLRALRDIAPGEEVFVSYGSHYWLSFQAPPAPGPSSDGQCTAKGAGAPATTGGVGDVGAAGAPGAPLQRPQGRDQSGRSARLKSLQESARKLRRQQQQQQQRGGPQQGRVLRDARAERRSRVGIGSGGSGGSREALAGGGAWEDLRAIATPLRSSIVFTVGRKEEVEELRVLYADAWRLLWQEEAQQQGKGPGARQSKEPQRHPRRQHQHPQHQQQGGHHQQKGTDLLKQVRQQHGGQQQQQGQQDQKQQQQEQQLKHEQQQQQQQQQGLSGSKRRAPEALSALPAAATIHKHTPNGIEPRLNGVKPGMNGVKLGAQGLGPLGPGLLGKHIRGSLGAGGLERLGGGQQVGAKRAAAAGVPGHEQQQHKRPRSHLQQEAGKVQHQAQQFAAVIEQPAQPRRATQKQQSQQQAAQEKPQKQLELSSRRQQGQQQRGMRPPRGIRRAVPCPSPYKQQHQRPAPCDPITRSPPKGIAAAAGTGGASAGGTGERQGAAGCRGGPSGLVGAVGIHLRLRKAALPGTGITRVMGPGS